MPAAVTYQIKGKYDNRATKEAKADLASFAKSVKSIGIAVWAKVGAEAVKGLSAATNGATETFVKQNKASRLLDATIQKSNKDFSQLLKYQDKLSRGNFFDGDSLKSAETLAINMGLAENEVINVMKAATDLAASGIMPLDQAVKALGQSYSGNVTTLSKYLPQMKELTKEQLRNGEAVKLVAEQYNGIADAMAGSFDGRNTQFQNSLDDMKASIGGIFQEIKFVGQGPMIDMINNVTEWIEKNRETIVKGILTLPSIFKEVFSLVGDMMKTTFSPDNFYKLMKNIGTITINLSKDIMVQILDLADILFANLTDMLTQFLGQSNAFKKIDAFLGGLVNKLDAALFDWPIHIDDWATSFMPTWLKDVLGIGTSNPMVRRWMEKRSDAEGNFQARWNDSSTWSGYNGGSSQFDAALNRFSEDITKNFENLKPQLESFGVDLGEIYGDNLKDFGKNIKKIIDEYELPADLMNALYYIQKSIDEGNDETDITSSSFGLDSATTGIDPVFGAVLEFMKKFENAAQIMEPMTTILNELFETIRPIVNEVLAPIVGYLKIIGRTLGAILIPLITALTPIIQAWATAITWMYNYVIVPVGNGIIGVFLAFKNAVITIVNGLIDMINNLPWVDVDRLSYSSMDDYRLQKISIDDLSTAGTVTESSSSSGASSYTAARDIYVTIQFDHSFVNGDTQEIAVMLRDEIARAERLGY